MMMIRVVLPPTPRGRKMLEILRDPKIVEAVEKRVAKDGRGPCKLESVLDDEP